MQLPLLWINVYYLEVQYNEQESTVVKKLTKADLQCCNVFVFTFIKHLFKRRDVLNIGCLVEKVTHHIVLIRKIKFSFTQVKQRPLKVSITWKAVGFLEFYIFTGYKNININTSSNAVHHQYFYLVVNSFVFSKKVFH